MFLLLPELVKDDYKDNKKNPWLLHQGLRVVNPFNAMSPPRKYIEDKEKRPPEIQW
jgi:hypothetical protein